MSEKYSVMKCLWKWFISIYSFSDRWIVCFGLSAGSFVHEVIDAPQKPILGHNNFNDLIRQCAKWCSFNFSHIIPFFFYLILDFYCRFNTWNEQAIVTYTIVLFFNILVILLMFGWSSPLFAHCKIVFYWWKLMCNLWRNQLIHSPVFSPIFIVTFFGISFDAWI